MNIAKKLANADDVTSPHYKRNYIKLYTLNYFYFVELWFKNFRHLGEEMSLILLSLQKEKLLVWRTGEIFVLSILLWVKKKKMCVY